MIYMNAPDLRQRPHWAHYWAQDENGDSFWFENHPICIEADRGQGVWLSSGGMSLFYRVLPLDSYGWTHSLLRIEGDVLIRVRPLHD